MKNKHTTDPNMYDDISYSAFCDGLEAQYNEAKETGLFKVFKILKLDKQHSDKELIKAVDYFIKKDGVIEKDAPDNFLTERERKIVNQNGKFRQDLYCMFLASQFAEAIQNKSAFIQDSLKFSFGYPE